MLKNDIWVIVMVYYSIIASCLMFTVGVCAAGILFIVCRITELAMPSLVYNSVLYSRPCDLRPLHFKTFQVLDQPSVTPMLYS